MFPRALPTALRPSYQKFFAKTHGMFDLNPKNKENFFEKNPLSFKTILSAHRRQFRRTLRIVFANSPK